MPTAPITPSTSAPAFDLSGLVVGQPTQVNNFRGIPATITLNSDGSYSINNQSGQGIPNLPSSDIQDFLSGNLSSGIIEQYTPSELSQPFANINDPTNPYTGQPLTVGDVHSNPENFVFNGTGGVETPEQAYEDSNPGGLFGKFDNFLLSAAPYVEDAVAIAVPALAPLVAAQQAAMAGSQGNYVGAGLSGLSAVGGGLTTAADAGSTASQVGQGISTAAQAGNVGANISQGDYVGAGLGSVPVLSAGADALTGTNPLNEATNTVNQTLGISTGEQPSPMGGMSVPLTSSQTSTPLGSTNQDITNYIYDTLGISGGMSTPANAITSTPINLSSEVSSPISSTVSSETTSTPPATTSGGLLSTALAFSPLLASIFSSSAQSSSPSPTPPSTPASPVSTQASQAPTPDAQGTALDLISLFNPAQAGYSPPSGGQGSWMFDPERSEAGMARDSGVGSFGSTLGENLAMPLANSQSTPQLATNNQTTDLSRLLEELGIAA